MIYYVKCEIPVLVLSFECESVRTEMPKNIIYKYRCKELVCNALVRSDKWNDHCKKKHSVKYNNNLEIKKEIISVREGSNSEWKKYTASVPSNESKVQEEVTKCR